MNRIALLVLLFAPAAFAQSFSVSFPVSVNAQPLDGRLLLVLSTDPSDEPRNQIDDTPRSQIVFGVTVDGWQPDHAQMIDSTAWGYPVHSLKDVPAGDYFVQAVLNKYETFHRSDGKTVKMHMDQGEGQHWNISPGNLYSKPVKIHVGPETTNHAIVLSEVIPPIAAPNDTKYIRHIRIQSDVSDEILGPAHVLECVHSCSRGLRRSPQCALPSDYFSRPFCE